MIDRDPTVGIGHLGYELAQMVLAAGQINYESDVLNPDTGAVQNALIESALLHARGLIEFLIDDRKLDDMRPEDFCPGWSGVGAEARTRLDNQRLLLHKHLIHLTWTRADDSPEPEPEDWFYSDTVREIVGHLEAFNNHMRTVLDAGGDVNPVVIRTLSAYLLTAQQEMATWPAEVRPPGPLVPGPDWTPSAVSSNTSSSVLLTSSVRPGDDNR